MAAVKASALWEKYREKARERKRAAGEEYGRGKVKVARPEPMSTTVEETEPENPEKTHKPKRAQSRDALGKAFDVSGASVERAARKNTRPQNRRRAGSRAEGFYRVAETIRGFRPSLILAE